MTTAKSPFTLYSIDFPNSPNPWKAAIVLEELGLEYNIVRLGVFAVKQKPYTDLNPNGRTPCLVDHNNNNFAIWESIAIIKYLVDRYDTEKRLTYADGNNKYLVDQWLLYQASGQGPYFGQATWFTSFHMQRVPSVITRYRAEIKRVLGVLNAALEGREWLVGDKMTVADLVFVPWHFIIPFACKEDTEWVLKDIPNYNRWMAQMTELPSVQTFLGEKRDRLSKDL
ncbi:glutathione S-transferase C-terminal-like protein [Coniochaeta sp. 2T2.1]|nr:glutathione S-transferase C-terminal-like protein [Coniochaeta sp. 2T2.1]